MSARLRRALSDLLARPGQLVLTVLPGRQVLRVLPAQLVLLARLGQRALKVLRG